MMEEFIYLDKLEYANEYMTSKDWKKRFIAEYAQLETRINRLLEYLWENENTLTDESGCPLSLLSLQLDKMAEYSSLLKIRADFYGIDIQEEIKKLNAKN